MWIVRLGLRRPLTVAVMAILLCVLGVVSFLRMNVDIFPAIHLRVVIAVWNYPGLSAVDMERRVVLISEGAFSTTMNGIEHIESESLNGVGLIKVFFHSGGRRRGHRADQLGVTDDPQDRPARHAGRERHRVQRRERPGRAAERLQRHPARAGPVRLRPQLHPRAPVHDRGARLARALRRRQPPDHRPTSATRSPRAT